MELIPYSEIKEKIIRIREKDVILDFDVAELYGVETKRVNEAVRNNPDKFLEDYIITLDENESAVLRSKISTLKKKGGKGHHSKFNYKAFTEQGLYMLATILKSPRATQATISIIETFTKIRKLSRTIGEMSAAPDKFTQKTLMEKSGEIMADLFGEDLQTNETETEIELNFAVLKLKHTIKRKGK